MKIKIFIMTFIIFAFIIAPSLVSAQEEVSGEDIGLLGIELELLISLITGVIALVLFCITFLAFQRDGRERFLYISIAFLLFAIKSFLVFSEVFVEIELIDPVAIFLELIVILLFFFGVIRKGG
jgi:hypothetical protein